MKRGHGKTKQIHQQVQQQDGHSEEKHDNKNITRLPNKINVAFPFLVGLYVSV